MEDSACLKEVQVVIDPLLRKYELGEIEEAFTFMKRKLGFMRIVGNIKQIVQEQIPCCVELVKDLRITKHYIYLGATSHGDGDEEFSFGCTLGSGDNEIYMLAEGRNCNSEEATVWFATNSKGKWMQANDDNIEDNILMLSKLQTKLNTDVPLQSILLNSIQSIH